MKILLDTQAFLWFITDASELNKTAKTLFTDPKNDFYLSLASLWEIAIKTSIGKLKLTQPIEKFIPAQLKENSINQLVILILTMLRKWHPYLFTIATPLIA